MGGKGVRCRSQHAQSGWRCQATPHGLPACQLQARRYSPLLYKGPLYSPTRSSRPCGRSWAERSLRGRSSKRAGAQGFRRRQQRES